MHYSRGDFTPSLIGSFGQNVIQNHRGVPCLPRHWKALAPLVNQNQLIYSWQKGGCQTLLFLFTLDFCVRVRVNPKISGCFRGKT